MELQTQEHRFGLYAEPPEVYVPSGVPAVEADTEDAAKRAVSVLVQDAIEADVPPTLHGVWDADARSWIFYPWPCPRCGLSTDGPGNCAACRRDVDLGETRSSRLDEEAETRAAREASERDVWEPPWIPS